MIKHKLNNAFTLIEMLVVISLIGVLAGLAVVSYGAAQKQARDTTRKSDMKQYQTALEMYANLSNGLFPAVSGGTAITATTACGYLNSRLEPDISCSQDPKISADPTYYDYRYIASSGTAGSASSSNYVIWAKIENSSTTKYWVVCSNGKNGESSSIPSSATCPI